MDRCLKRLRYGDIQKREVLIMEMTPEEKRAYEWALQQPFHSVAADNARILAKYIERSEPEPENPLHLHGAELDRAIKARMSGSKY